MPLWLLSPQVWLLFLVGTALALLLAAGFGAFGKPFRVLLALFLTLLTCALVFEVTARVLEPGSRERGGDWQGMFVVMALYAAAASAVPLLALFLWLAFRLPASLQSGRRSPVPLALALLLAMAVALSLAWPAFTGPRTAAKKIVYPAHGRVSADAERARHGRWLVRALVREVHDYPEERARQENDTDNEGLKQALGLLGQAGTPAAVAELRTWLHRDVAKDVRAAAAQALGTAHDGESAPMIAALLRDRQTWRRHHRELCSALVALPAHDQLSAIVDGLWADDGERRPCEACLVCLRGFRTAEADDALIALATRGHHPMRRWAVKVMGREPSRAPFLPALLDALRDEDPFLRFEACQSLRESSRGLPVWRTLEHESGRSGIELCRLVVSRDQGPAWADRVRSAVAGSAPPPSL